MDYSDIINLNHYVSKKRNKMSIWDRSAQFAPFDALEGYSEEIEETSRLTTSRIEISEEVKEKINEKLKIINSDLSKEAMITYFIKDKYKIGGKYKSIKSKIKKIDTIYKKIILIDNNVIPIVDVVDVKIMIWFYIK